MEPAEFAEAVGALQVMLGIPAEDDEPIAAPYHLAIDAFEVVLDHTDDERALRVSLSVGALAGDPVHRQGQLRRILKRNLALLRDFRFVAVLEQNDAEQLVLQLRFAESYGGLRASALAGQPAELVTMAEFYGELIGGTQQRKRAAAPVIEETLIFRP